MNQCGSIPGMKVKGARTGRANWQQFLYRKTMRDKKWSELIRTDMSPASG
jgi:hypothetical protein